MTPVEKIEKAKNYIELGNELMKETLTELSTKKSKSKRVPTSLEQKKEKMLKKLYKS
jgi:hypothetical protein